MENELNVEIGSDERDNVETTGDNISSSSDGLSESRGRPGRGRGKQRNSYAEPITGESGSGDNSGESGRSERSEANRRYKKQKATIDSMSGQLGFLSFAIAGITKNSELALSKEEADKLAKEYMKMSEAWGWEMSIDPRYVATFSFAFTVGSIYIPKVSKMNHRKQVEKKKKEEEALLNANNTNQQ